MNYENNRTGEIINEENYHKLSWLKRMKYSQTNDKPTHYLRENSDGDFVLSMLVTEMTDNAMLGYMTGGNLSGAIIGDMLSDNNDFLGNGGEFGGGGSTIDLDTNDSSYDNSSSYDSSDCGSSDCGSCDCGSSDF